jgi:hypothetical protein|eukprot:jgi/Picre1/28191/NNA_003597.t1
MPEEISTDAAPLVVRDTAILDLEPHMTCDGELMDALEARMISRRYYMMGFFGIPFFWGVNAWYFSSDSQSPSQDPVVSRLVFKSRLLFIGSMLIIFGWMTVYLIDGKDLLGEDVYNALSINSFKVLQQAGF